MRKLTQIAILGCATLMMSGPLQAQEFQVEIHKTKQLKVRGKVDSVIIGNPEVADVSVHTTTKENLLFVTGRDFGSTNLLIFDDTGKQIYSGDVIVSANASTFVSVRRAGETNTYDCVPRCRPAQSAESAEN